MTDPKNEAGPGRGFGLLLAAVVVVVLGALTWRFAAAPLPPPTIPPVNTGGGSTGGGNTGGGNKGGGNTGGGNTGGAPAPQDEIVPAAKAKEVSPLLEAHAAWPRPEALVAPAATPEVTVRSQELETDVRRWFVAAVLPRDWRSGVGVDSSGQVYVKLGTPGGPVSGVATRNRPTAPGLQTLSFAVTFSRETTKLDAKVLEERLGQVLTKQVVREIISRLDVHPDFASGENLAGNVMMDPDGVGRVFPYFYYYARPKGLVGVFQTIPMMKVK